MFSPAHVRPENRGGIGRLFDKTLFTAPVEAQNVGKHEVVKHRRTITKPVVQNIFSDQTSKPDVVPKKSNLKSSKLDAATEAEDNRISTLIHMTSNHDENINKEKDKILSGRHRHETETVSLRSGDNYQSMAESLFFADSSPATNKRPASFHLTDYGDTLSQSSQTSA